MKSLMSPIPPRLQGSAPTRGPWIEIAEDFREVIATAVGPHTGAVD